MIETEEEPAELRANGELVASLLPYLQKVHDSWVLLRANKIWKTSKAYENLMEYLKNCFR